MVLGLMVGPNGVDFRASEASALCDKKGAVFGAAPFLCMEGMGGGIWRGGRDAVTGLSSMGSGDSFRNLRIWGGVLRLRYRRGNLRPQ